MVIKPSVVIKQGIFSASCLALRSSVVTSDHVPPAVIAPDVRAVASSCFTQASRHIRQLMSQQAAEQTTAYCLSHGLGVYLQDALQLYPTAQQPAHGTSASTQPHAQGSNSATATSNRHQPNLFLAPYLTSVVCCQHVLWRRFAFVSGLYIRSLTLL